MFSGWSQREIAEYRRNMEMTDRMRSGDNCGYSDSTVKRWLTFRLRADEGDRYALLRGKSTGRGTITVNEDEAIALRSAYVTSNRCHGKGSMTYAARSVARDNDSPLRQEVRDAILKDRCSKHILPVNVRRAMRGTDAVVANYRDPRTVALGGMFASGTLRMTTGLDGVQRRLYGGERWCVDDASINFGVCVPWERQGDPCSEKYGVRVGRYQLLAAIDCASDYCVGFTYAIREHDAYRGDDVVAMLNNVMTLNGYKPDELVVEGGSWQSRRVIEFLRMTGIKMIDAKGRPHQKLIENWLNRLWTPLSDRTGGQVGRKRGEMAKESKLFQACRSGAEDPRKHFPLLTTALNAIKWSIDYINEEIAHSREYGNWVPSKVYASGLKDHVRPGYQDDVSYLASRVRERRQIRRFGMVKITATSPLGFPEVYHFGGAELSAYNGADVWIHFDPFAHPVLATVTLADDFQDTRAGTVIAKRLEPMNSAPELMQTSDGLFYFANHNGIETTRKAKVAIQQMVRRETQVLGLGKARIAGITEISAPVKPSDLEEAACFVDPSDPWTPGDAIKQLINPTPKLMSRLEMVAG